MAPPTCVRTNDTILNNLTLITVRLVWQRGARDWWPLDQSVVNHDSYFQELKAVARF